MQSKWSGSGRRIADDDIYINEDRREKPKDIFVHIGNILEEKGAKNGGSCIDIGCATGDLLHYLSFRFPKLKLSGFDVSQKMLELARKRLPSVEFIQGDISVPTLSPTSKFDFSIMSGVLNCFDDTEPVLSNLVNLSLPNGRIVVLDMINDHPVDVIMRHRRVIEGSDTEGEWESGWNYVSRATIKKILDTKSNDIDKYQMLPFAMSQSLIQREDPMRTWTIETKKNPRQLVNGAQQLVQLQFLIIDLKS